MCTQVPRLPSRPPIVARRASSTCPVKRCDIINYNSTPGLSRGSDGLFRTPGRLTTNPHGLMWCGRRNLPARTRSAGPLRVTHKPRLMYHTAVHGSWLASLRAIARPSYRLLLARQYVYYQFRRFLTSVDSPLDSSPLAVSASHVRAWGHAGSC
jgi:hypothetical protein